MGCSDGEAISVLGVGGTGGCRAFQGGNAGCAIAPTHRGLRRRGFDLEPVCLIGQGSAALVYLVRCKRTGKMSALKVQRKADHMRSVERVHMEREVMVDACHPLVAKLHSAFQDKLYLYLHMEYCPGGSLDNFIGNVLRRNLTEVETRFYAAEITLGLEFLHSRGYVYRDLKAANVLVTASGHIKLTDFGEACSHLAKFLGIAERGEVRIGTEDQTRAESCEEPALPRTQSSPGLGNISRPNGAAGVPPLVTQPVAPSVLTSSQASPERLNSSGVEVTVRRRGSLESLRALLKTPPRGSNSHRRAATVDGTLSKAKRSSDCVPPAPKSAISRGGSVAYACLSPSTPFHRKSVNGFGQSTAVTAAPPRPPSLRSRFRDKFLRPARGSLGAPSPSSISCTEVSSLPSTEGPPNGQVTEGRTVGAEEMQGVKGATTPYLRRRGSTGGRRESTKRVGLPPSGPEGSLQRDRCGSPRHIYKQTTRQATVQLAEASWHRFSGSPEYMAPEVLMHTAQGSALDWWGLGILTYELLLGRTPFAGEGGKTRHTYLNIMHKEAEFPGLEGRPEGKVSADCQSFVRSLLAKNPSERAGSMGSHVVKSHPFFSSVCWEELLARQPPLVPGGIKKQYLTRPLSVKNTSGWSWAAEDAHTEVQESQSDEDTHDDSPFDRFDWTDVEDEEDPYPYERIPPEQGRRLVSVGGMLAAGGEAVAVMAAAAIGAGAFAARANTLSSQSLRAPVF